MANDNNDKLLIRLHVYDTEMSVNVPRSDEALYRNAAILITDTVNSYASFYKGRKSDKELLYMAMIDIALRWRMCWSHQLNLNHEDSFKQISGL